MVIKSDGENDEYLYLHRDYLGSILAISNEAAAIVEKRHFDPWGNIVKLQDGQSNDLDELTVLDRGYTGHEHLQSVELIHMNGRLYDAKLHRFLAPDNYVQDPYNTQNFNRYGYVLNSPLMYTDPSGELGILAAIAIGAAVSAGMYTLNALTADVPFTIGGFAKNAFIGALSGTVTFGIGQAAATIGQLVPRIAMQAVAHGMSQGWIAGLQGGNFWQGFASGAIASLASSGWSGLGGTFAQSGAGQILFGTISGGAGAALTGGNFWEGAAVGFVVSALNHVAHGNPTDPKKKKQSKKGDSYTTDKSKMTPSEFRDRYADFTEDQIMTGESSFLGYKYPNDMKFRDSRFVILENGKEVDMIHFMVVGRAGHILGLGNEFQQLFRLKRSAFNPQDLYSNQLGVKFFKSYGARISQNPNQISNYIYQYLTSQKVLYPKPYQPQFPTGPKY